MKVLALVYPGMTLLDLVGPLQAGVFCPATKFSMPGTVRVQCPRTAASACRRPTVSTMLGLPQRPLCRRRCEAHIGPAGRFRRNRLSS